LKRKSIADLEIGDIIIWANFADGTEISVITLIFDIGPIIESDTTIERAYSILEFTTNKTLICSKGGSEYIVREEKGKEKGFIVL